MGSEAAACAVIASACKAVIKFADVQMGEALLERALSSESTFSHKTWRTELTNRIVHRTIRLAPATLVAIALVAFLLFLTTSSALGQDDGSSAATPSATPTSTAGTPTPEADPEEPAEGTVVREDCIEDGDTGELTCITTTEPEGGAESDDEDDGGGIRERRVGKESRHLRYRGWNHRWTRVEVIHSRSQATRFGRTQLTRCVSVDRMETPP